MVRDGTRSSGFEEVIMERGSTRLSLRWQDLVARQTLFWSSSPAREEHSLRLARFGLRFWHACIVLIGIAELAFITSFLASFIR